MLLIDINAILTVGTEIGLPVYAPGPGLPSASHEEAENSLRPDCLTYSKLLYP